MEEKQRRICIVGHIDPGTCGGVGILAKAIMDRLGYDVEIIQVPEYIKPFIGEKPGLEKPEPFIMKQIPSLGLIPHKPKNKGHNRPYKFHR